MITNPAGKDSACFVILLLHDSAACGEMPLTSGMDATKGHGLVQRLAKGPKLSQVTSMRLHLKRD